VVFGGVVVGFVEFVSEVAEIVVLPFVELVVVVETAQYVGLLEVHNLQDRRLEVLVRRRRKQRVAKQERL